MPRPAQKSGVFCLEGEWWRDLRRSSSVEPILRLLSTWAPYQMPYIHRDIGTVGEFEHYLLKWRQKKYSAYPVLYLGFHGYPGVLKVSERGGPNDDGRLDLAWLAERLKGRCKGRVIYVSTCGTLKLPLGPIRSFLKETCALAVCGYTRNVSWIDSAAFEVLLLASLQRFEFTPAGARAARRSIRRQAPGLCAQLDFRMYVSGS